MWSFAFGAPPASHAEVVPEGHQVRGVYQVGSEIRLRVRSYDPNQTHNATRYTVRDVTGTQVAAGAIPVEGVIPLDHLASELGWFKVYLERDTPEPAPWGLCAGEGSFAVMRSVEVPVELENAPGSDPGGEGTDVPLRAAMDQQAPRCPIRRGTLARDVDAALTTWAQVDRLYTAPPPIRWVAFPDPDDYHLPEVQDELRPQLQRLIDAGIDHFEFWNEPFAGAHPAAYGDVETRFVAFATLVRGLGGKAMGVTTVSIQENGPWERLITEHADLIDVVTFHNYDGFSPGVTGNIARARVTFDRFQRVLERSGNQGKPLYNTEAPSILSSPYGSFEPMRQAAWSTLEMHVSMQYGVGLRNFCRFKDRQVYYDYPSGYSGNAPYPALLMLKTMWDMLGDTPGAPIPVGPVADDYVLATRFDRPDGKTVVVLQTDGWQGTLRCAVPPGAERFGPYGQRLAGTSDGVFVDQVPRYLVFDTAHDLRFERPFPSLDVGRDQTPRVGVSSHKPAVVRPDAPYMNRPPSDGGWTLAPLEPRLSAPLQMWHTEDGKTSGEWIEYSFPQPVRLDSILLDTPYGWQNVSTNLGFRVEVDGDEVWSENMPAPTSVEWTSTPRTEATFSETYWMPQTVWYMKFPARRVSTVKIVFTDATYGGIPTETAGTSAGHGDMYSSGQGDKKHVTLRRVRLGLSTQSDGGTASPGNPHLNIS